MVSILVTEYVVSTCSQEKCYRSLLSEAYGMVLAVTEALARAGANVFVTVSKYVANCFENMNRIVVENSYMDFVEEMSKHVDYVIAIAPPLELVEIVGRIGKKFLGPSYKLVKIFSNKYETTSTLSKCSVKTPYTKLLSREDNVKNALKDFEMPIVIKPAMSAGSECNYIVNNVDEAIKYVEKAFGCDPLGHVVLQEYVEGVHGSISSVFNGEKLVFYSLNLQLVSLDGNRFVYRGNVLPIRNQRYVQWARNILESMSSCLNGLGGYIGVDVVWNDSGMYVVEVNPRITTSAIGIANIYKDFGHVLLKTKSNGIFLGDVVNGYAYVVKASKILRECLFTCSEISEEICKLVVGKASSLKEVFDIIGEETRNIIYRVDEDLF
ncbi:ATP-grasp domain-containing protein [Ignisphaera sp. 4213-co]|uniref:ATP-grasp domain-containing protein n=1 Tax=Ignisphaera cupida TaxID=3050454 RepID=A0ABD4Z6N0_9CREN|nr:ATP-grasp domain-containing protein [Ignisphaera sp. 4213-co]MDK6028779.1 ATP-grasp domain-containing protein [Ignisphaera sp. 4213-co]